MLAANKSALNPMTFAEQQVELLSHGGRNALPLLLCAVMIAGIAAPHAPRHWVLAWFISHVSILLIRAHILHRLQRRPAIPIENRLRLATWVMLASGISHGLSLFLFYYLPPFERAAHSLVLMCIAAAGASMCAGHRPRLYAFVVPTIVPLALLWILMDDLRQVGMLPGLMGALIGFAVIVIDAMARHTATILRDLFQIRQELKRALDDAETASRAKTRFLASASHDLRQPIQAALLFAGALTRRPLDKNSLELANSINEALSDLSGELNALLDISKLDAGTVSAARETVDLTALVLRTERTFSAAARAKGLTMQMQSPASAHVCTDRLILERILRNLMENAVKYTDAGTISISVTSHHASYTVCVADTGPGIAAAEREAVFEEFYQLNNPGRDRRRGLGLGLAIVKRLADLLQSRVSLQSEEGVGSMFSLELPAALPDAKEVFTCLLDVPRLALADVLVVDDEDGIRAGMKALLEEFGCNVRLAMNTQDALDSIRASCPDLLITDFRLGALDSGVRTIISAREQHPKLPAILITGETTPERLREAHNAGISVIHKPVTSDAIKEVLYNVFNPIVSVNGQPAPVGQIPLGHL